VVVSDMADEGAAVVEDNELRVFVASTLGAIMGGISDAQPNARTKSAHGTGVYGFSAPKDVAFDLAVTVKRNGTKKGGFKVQVWSIGANAETDSSSENSTVSRIQFTIPTKLKKTPKPSERKTEAEE